MLRSILSGNNFTEIMIGVLSTAFVVFFTLPILQYAQAWTATKLGDDTPRLSGRLTLSPLAHIDWLGAIMIFIVGFGYGKPVPVNMNNFNIKNKKVGLALVALSMPITCFILASVFILLSNICSIIYMNGAMPLDLAQIIASFFSYATIVNISLGVFSLIPIPPLSGSRILFAIIPDKYFFKIMQYERQITIVMMILLFTGVFSVPISVVSTAIYNGLVFLISLPFNLF